MRAVAGGSSAGNGFSFASCDRKNVVLETIKLAEDGNGVIVRLYETQNTRCKATVRFADAIKSVKETNLLEETSEEETTLREVNEHDFSFEIKPYEIKTFRITF